MYNIVAKRGWYFLFSALLLIPGLSPWQCHRAAGLSAGPG